MSRAHAELDPHQEKDTNQDAHVAGLKTADSDNASDPSFEDGAEYPTEEDLRTLKHVPYSTPSLPMFSLSHPARPLPSQSPSASPKAQENRKSI